MTWKERFAFLDAKRRLLAPHLRADSARNYERMYTHVLAQMDSAPEPIPDSALRAMDAALERSIAEEIVDEDERAVRAELKQRFGFASFGEEPRAVLRRIKRAGRIENEAEAILVDQYLSGDYLGGLGSDAEQARFAAIARDYYERTR